MANEITQNITLSATKNGANVNISTSARITMAGDDLLQNTQLVGTTAELLDLGEIASNPSQLCIKNLDAANFIEIGGDSGLTVFKLKLLAGQSTLLQPSSGTIYVKADTASVRILVVACEL